MSRGIPKERMGWDIASGALFLVIVTISLTLPEEFPGSRWMLLAVAVGILAVYVFGARPYVGIKDGGLEPTPSASAVVQACLVTLLAVGVAIEPNMLLMQTIVLPLIWMTSLSTVQSVTVTCANAVILGLAYSFWGGFQPELVMGGFITSGLSAAFSLALGLWITRIAEWGAERHRLLAELTAAQAGLEAASRDAGATAERARLAREVHDTVAQSLTSIVMLAERARRDGSPNAIELIEAAAREALRETRTLVTITSPADGNGSLGDALRRLGDRFARETGVDVTVTASDAVLPRDLQVVLLRCAQEGLANVRKHSGATTATVLLESGADARLTIRDHGRGLGGVSIDDDRGFGLLGMRDRVALVGGSLTVRDAEGSGAVLTVTVPVPRVESMGEVRA